MSFPEPPVQTRPHTVRQVSRPPVKRRGRIVLAVLAVAALMAGTGVGVWLLTRPDPAAAPAVQSAASPTEATTAAAPPVASNPAVKNKLGTPVTIGGGAGRVTAHGFQQPVAKNAPRPDQPGFEWAAADVEVCALIDGAYVNNQQWRLVYADHSTIDPSSTGYEQFPLPQYPWDDRDLPKDRCVRGWITYPAPVGKRPVSIEYNRPGSLAEWAVTASG